MLAHHHSLQVRSPLKIEIKTNKYIAQRKQTMKIVFLDSKTIGDDIDLSEYDKLGEVVKYDFSTTEEAAERTRDADVIVSCQQIISSIQLLRHGGADIVYPYDGRFLDTTLKYRKLFIVSNCSKLIL